jgi:hypothetical protein
MYCPDCGKENGENHRFCRSCGAELHGEALARTSGDALPAKRAVDSELSRVGFVINNEELRMKVIRFQKGWHSPLSYAFLLVVLGITIVVLGNHAFQEKDIADIGTVLALLGVGLMGLKGVLMTVASVRNERERTAILPAAESTNPLGPAYLPPPHASVVEHTTRTLEPEEIKHS